METALHNIYLERRNLWILSKYVALETFLDIEEVLERVRLNTILESALKLGINPYLTRLLMMLGDRRIIVKLLNWIIRTLVRQGQIQYTAWGSPVNEIVTDFYDGTDKQAPKKKTHGVT